MNKEYGWICDCGRWTKGDDAYHAPLKMGFREIIDCRKLRQGVNIESIVQVSPELKRRYIKDVSVCNICDIPGCPGSVRFDKNYFELGYIETNLPMCPHAEYEED